MAYKETADVAGSNKGVNSKGFANLQRQNTPAPQQAMKRQIRRALNEGASEATATRASTPRVNSAPRYNGPAAPSSQEQRNEQNMARQNSRVATSKPIMVSTNGGGRSARPDPEAGNKPLNGSISRPNVKKKDGLNFRSNMMAGASASAGRAQQRKPMPKSRSTPRERTK